MTDEEAAGIIDDAILRCACCSPFSSVEWKQVEIEDEKEVIIAVINAEKEAGK